jgi:hypothetical protein
VYRNGEVRRFAREDSDGHGALALLRRAARAAGLDDASDDAR